ncbi:SAC3/GANP family protein [Histomonas meleagridis]|uniref:SAC3/GANP family protein n=1 Tax=Histomonas meleagridis TaxID=135588 RepID=UPI003559FE73|nr:SAC3/GANP family protein [Histomonas meleagridis]KAH0805512.1 SAC3/GANP family protein [Histomonas meleagridis]
MNDYQSQPTNDQAMRFNRPPENIRSNSKKFDDRRPLNRYTHNERSQQYNDNQKRDFGYDDENYDNRKPLNRYASNESEQYDNRRDNEQSQQYNDNQKRGFGYYDENQFNSENRNYNQFNSEQMNNYQSQPTNDQVMRFNRPPENVRSDSEKFDDRRPLNRYTHNERSQQYNDNQKRDFGYDDENYSNQKRDFRYDDENYDNRKPLNRYANNESEQYDNRRDKKYTDNERSQQYNDNQKRGLGYNDKNYDNKRDVSAKYNNENRYSSDDENGYDHRNRNFFRYSDDDEYDRESDIGNEPNKQTKINKNKKFQKQKKTKPKKQNKVTQLPPLPKKLPLHKPIIKKEVEEPAPIVGTSTAMEKQYLRLAGNTLPDASNFRPLPILIQSFEYCLGKYEQNKDYEYISEQLRSIRQDLLVQHIENPFCVKVYEKHAHLAIMNEDWGNFNQSMTSLEKLYKMNFGEYENICEFFCYRIVYSIGVDDEAGLYSFIPRIPENVILSDQVQIALKIWKFSNTGEWVKFFEIMNNASDFLKKVMSIKAKQMRFLALSSSVKGMRKLSLEGFREFLFLQTIEETREYLAQNEVSIPE